MLQCNDRIYHQAAKVHLMVPSRILVMDFPTVLAATDSPVVQIGFDSTPGWILGFTAAAVNEFGVLARPMIAIRLWLNNDEELITKGNPQDLVPAGGRAYTAFANVDDLSTANGVDTAMWPLMRRVGRYDRLYGQVRNVSALDPHRLSLAFFFSKDGDEQLPECSLSYELPTMDE